MVVVLDSGILGQLVHKDGAKRAKVEAFLETHQPEITALVIPEIADYEVRRSLLKIGSIGSVKMLDQLVAIAKYEPFSTPQVRRAAEIWAHCRKNGFPFCDDKELDGDCFVIAQTESYGPTATVLTTNPNDIGRFVKVEAIS